MSLPYKSPENPGEEGEETAAKPESPLVTWGGWSTRIFTAFLCYGKDRLLYLSTVPGPGEFFQRGPQVIRLSQG